VRFAPSPTGALHIGSARTALYNYLYARRHHGSLILRVEDTDVARSHARHERAILADLRWLGLVWDEGPDVGGAYGPYRQSERLERYRAAAADLLERGLAYHCFCSEERLAELRHEQLQRGEMPKYDRRCAALGAEEARRRVAAGEPAAVRLRVPPGTIAVDDLLRGRVAFDAAVVGDFIILRSGGVAAYNFAVVVDDADMAITHVIRGDDHLTNTARQVVLFGAIGVRPPHYAHHSLVLAPDGGKLSKRHGAVAVGEYRGLGYLPSAIANYLALLSWSHGEEEVLSLPQLEREFDLERLSTSPAIFDLGKLDWLDRRHIMALDAAAHERLVGERLPPGTPRQAVAALAAALQPSISRYGEVDELAVPILTPPADPAGIASRIEESSRAALSGLAGLRAALPDWLDPEAAHALLVEFRAYGTQRGLAPRQVLMPLRLALTGREHGPELHYVLAAIDKQDTLARVVAVTAASPSQTGPSPRRRTR
jgi:nondiscriminating glutamyl-tRNA synthetase